MAEMVDGDDDGAARAKRARPERVTGFEDGSLTDAQEAHIEALIAAVQNGTPMPGPSEAFGWANLTAGQRQHTAPLKQKMKDLARDARVTEEEAKAGFGLPYIGDPPMSLVAHGSNAPGRGPHGELPAAPPAPPAPDPS